MPVIVWIFAKDQTQTLNYVPIKIADSEVGFSPFGANNYRQVVSQAVDQAGGRAFVTEMAQPTSALRPPSDPDVTLLFQQYPYLTRHYTRISPDEMTSDPTFDIMAGLPNVSNVHDLSNRPAPWSCSDESSTFKPVANSGPPPCDDGRRPLPEPLRRRAAAQGRADVRDRRAVGAAIVPPGARPASAATRTSRAWSRSIAVARRAGASANSRVDSAKRLGGLGMARLARDAVILLFFEMVVLQGIHEIEHIVQVVQRTVLGIGEGRRDARQRLRHRASPHGLQRAFLGLLGAVYAGCRRDPSSSRRTRHGDALLQVSFFFQIWHTVEHVVKMWQYFTRA